MIHAHEFQKSPLPFAPAGLSVVDGPHNVVSNQNLPAPVLIPRTGAITLSFPQILFGFAAAMGSIMLFIWAVVRLWLFGR